MSVSVASGHVTSCDSCLSHRQTVWKRASGAQQCICIEGSDVMRECLSSALISFCHSDLRLFEWTQHAGRCCDVASFIFLSLSVERRKWHHIAADEWRTGTNTNHKRWYWAGHAAGPLGSEGQRGRQGQDLLRIVFVPDVSLISSNTSVQLWADLTLMCFHQLYEDTTTQQSCVTYRNFSFSFPALRLTVMHLLTHTDWSCREFKKTQCFCNDANKTETEKQVSISSFSVMNTVCSQVWKDFKQTEGSSADPVLRQRSWNVLNKHRRWSVLVISDPALSGADVILHMKTDSDSNIRSALRIIVYLKPRYQPGSGNIWIGVCQIMIVAQTPIITNTCAGADFMVQVLQGYLGRSARWSLSRERTLCFTFTSGVLTPVTSAPLT